MDFAKILNTNYLYCVDVQFTKFETVAQSWKEKSRNLAFLLSKQSFKNGWMDWAQIFRDNTSHYYKYFDVKNFMSHPSRQKNHETYIFLFFAQYLPKE